MSLKYEHLEGIDFTGIGKRDCYELCRDFYRENFDIELTPFARPHDWNSDDIDLIRMLYERDGFQMITDWAIKDLRPADVLAMSINEANPNHLAINLGNGDMLHHLYGRRSSIVPLAGWWRNHTAFVLRHPAVPDLRPSYPSVDYLELLNARNTPQAG